jgi:hypothetical protein
MSLSIVGGFFVVISIAALRMLETGYKLRH